MNAHLPIAILLTLVWSAAAPGVEARAQESEAGPPLYDDLGDHHYAVTTSVPRAATMTSPVTTPEIRSDSVAITKSPSIRPSTVPLVAAT